MKNEPNNTHIPYMVRFGIRTRHQKTMHYDEIEQYAQNYILPFKVQLLTQLGGLE
jgi:hypothetical protein